LSRKIEYPFAAVGKIRARNVLSMCSCFISRKFGMAVTSAGKAMVARKKRRIL